MRRSMDRGSLRPCRAAAVFSPSDTPAPVTAVRCSGSISSREDVSRRSTTTPGPMLPREFRFRSTRYQPVPVASAQRINAARSSWSVGRATAEGESGRCRPLRECGAGADIGAENALRSESPSSRKRKSLRSLDKQ
jgi:hypothetical protein